MIHHPDVQSAKMSDAKLISQIKSLLMQLLFGKFLIYVL